MNRKTVTAGLKAIKSIDASIARKVAFACDLGMDEYQDEAERLREIKREMLRCLNELPERGAEYIWRHYIKGEPWAMVCQRSGYSERQIRNIAARGLDTLAESFEAIPHVVRFCESAVSSYTPSEKS